MAPTQPLLTQFRLQLDTNLVPLALGSYVIGRGADCEFSFPDDGSMSRRHARLLVKESGVEIEDLGSTNGTFVAGRWLTGPVRLSHGEVVRIGTHELRVLAPRTRGQVKTTQPETPSARVSHEEELSTERTSVFEVIRPPLERALQASDIELAKKVLEPALDALMQALRLGESTEPEPVQKAAECLFLMLDKTHDGRYLRLLRELEKTSGHSLRRIIDQAEKLRHDDPSE